MDNNNNNQILDVDGWPNDVYGFLRGTRSNGVNMWVTFLLEDKVELNDTNDKKRCGLPDIGKEERNVKDEKRVNEEEDGVNEEEEYYNPYIRLYADCEDWGYGDGMPAAWRQ
ncbi:uncharacterized protein LOC110458282 [Mizuhopecten yessoensis]|uniref:Uncharacterized protein n=1 Tax=Mizuhopecten yessoensis TaxID=6573 RepID=A0A210Q6Y4_MIZYE|nr:uncharacterized protein LOC110458282 [Mizuhopecten yessoensis]OWF44503.1 hypothetical protein KP79_PYT05807 [Mizuhopecten yessoensis]